MPTTPIKGVNPETVARVLKAITAKKGTATLKDIVESTGLRYRVVHNLTWRMEGAPRNGTLLHREEAVIRRTNLGRTVTYGVRPKGDTTANTESRKYATRGLSVG
jgi:hypothetical protein